mgnify:CR=1 FL=1
MSGGAERYLIELAPIFRSLGFHVRAYQSARGEWTREYNGIEVCGLDTQGLDSRLNEVFHTQASPAALTLYHAYYLAAPLAAPHSIGTEQTLAHAHEVLRSHHIRHLPVLQGGKLVGMLTQRDLALVETLKDVDPNSVKVEDAMSGEVYTVSPDAPLDEVVQEMADPEAFSLQPLA